jgi:hypothetical protein
MDAKKLSFGIATVTGLALVLLLVLVAGAMADSSQAGAVTPTEPDAAVAASAASTPTLWSSGWTPITQNEVIVFHHNLGRPPEQLAVDLWFKDTDPGGLGVHRANYGGLEISGTVSTWLGAYWRNLTANTIAVHRLPQDQTIDEVNVKVWVAPPPDYDTGWESVSPGIPTGFFYFLGDVTETELAVSMWFSHTTLGIHQFSYGGLTDGEEEQGVHWRGLTDFLVDVYRGPDDVYAEQVRLVVNRIVTPDYDSLVALGGWQPITPGVPFTFTHNLNRDPDLLLVRAECRDAAPGGAGIHQMWAGGDEAGGDFRGAHLQNLTANSVQFVRRDNDDSCDEARVIIFKRSTDVYLPLVLSGAE